MREIKFRAWIKNRQQMDMVDCLELRKNVNVKYIHTRLHGLKLKPFEVELMQYTGLKDRDSKEIYEGDILKYGSCVEVVFYEPTMGRFMTELKKCNDESKIGEISSLSPYYTDNYKVIGNIFENSEVLK